MSGPDKRRRHPRFTVEDVRGELVLTSSVEVLNLSLGGVAIRADRRLNIGAEYTLKLEMDDRTIAMQGVVVWSVLSGMRKVRGEDVPWYSAGLKFAGVLTDKLQGLIEFIDENKLVEEHRLAGLRFQVEAAGKALLDTLESYRVRLISLSGMLIEADRALEVERTYAMSFRPSRSERVSFSGRVACCTEADGDGPRRYRIGIAFHEMAGPDRRRLEVFVTSLTHASPAP